MPKDGDVETWITVSEMGRMLSLGRTKCYELARSEAFETVKIGRALRINRKSLEEWICRQSSIGPNASVHHPLER